MTITFEPLSPLFGARVHGVDPRDPFDDATAQVLRDALTRHRLLLFRGYPLAEDDQVRLSQVAGKLTYRKSGNYTDPHRKSSLVSNVHEGGLFGNGELSFHSDLSFTEHFLKARSLYALVLPDATEQGGDTLYADVEAAYDDLPAETKERVEGLRARFAATYDYGDRSETVEWVRPLIGTHPQTGRRFIAASRAVTKEVEGLERALFRPLLKELWAHMEQPRYIYRHRWQLEDCLFWDNIGLQHARTPFDSAQKRALRAVSIDDPAVAAIWAEAA
jgi:alpha-ketoglutarate-dependent taurine dioxygenase